MKIPLKKAREFDCGRSLDTGAKVEANQNG
jgi:hypothetical protein